MKKLCYILIIILAPNYQAICQDKAIVDSLMHQLENNTSDTLKVKAYIDLWFQFHRSDPSKAIGYVENAKQLSEKINYTWGLAIANYRLGNRHIDLGDFVQAEKVLGLAVEYSETINDSILLAQSYSGLGNLYLEKSEYERAVSNYLVSMDLFEKKQDLNSVAIILNKIGTLFNRQKQHHKALAQYERALAIVRELNSLPGISACLTNIGMVHETLKEYDKALAYLEEALLIKVKTGDKLGESRVLQNIGNIYQGLKQYDLSNDYFTRAMKLGEEIGYPLQIMDNLYNLGTNEFITGNYKQSIFYAQEALNRNPKSFSLLAKIHALLSKANIALNDFERGYEHAWITSALKDSLYNEQSLQLSNDLEAKYQNEKKEKEIATLQATSEIDKLKLQTNKKERLYLIGFALLTLLLGLVLWSRYRIKVKSHKKLMELDQLKSHFFANISHEFRTPLTIITGLLKERLFSLKAEDSRDVATMYRSAQRLQNLIDQLLDLSKIDAKSMKLIASEGEVYEYLRAIGSSFSSYAFQRNIHYQTNIPDHQVFGFFDHDKLEKIVSNLLSNAFKFTPEKGLVVFNACDDNGYLHLVVEDTGVGMAQEELTKIFGRFYQIDNGRTRSQEGAGIGLALTKELTELHHGQISVESTAGSGSVFKVSLPLKKERYLPAEISSNGPGHTYKQPLLTSSNLQNSDTITETKKTIELPILLLVEDNADLRHFIANRLDGYKILEAANGAEGLKKANSFIPDLIITDVMMPNMDGMAFVEHLKKGEATGHIPVIMLTAKADMPSKIEGLETGVDNYLTKPFEMQELQVRIKNLIGQRKKLRERFSRTVILKPKDIAITSADEKFLEKVMAIIESHLDDPGFLAEDFQKEIGMSRMQLHRKLKALTDHAPGEFIRVQRLVRASEMLSKTDSNVTEVCYQTGFTSLSYFAKCFKKQFGTTPKAYAAKHSLAQ